MFKIFFMFLAVLISPALLNAQEIWKITSLDWQPYSGADCPNQGISIEKLRNVLKKAGITLVVEIYPWKRAQDLARTKDYVGYFPAWPEEVYEGFVASPTVDWSEVGILKVGGTNIAFSSMDELFRAYIVGIVDTYAYPKEIEDAMRKYPQHVERAIDETILVRKLAAGRQQAIITDPKVTMWNATKNNITNIETVKIIMKKELVVAMRNEPDNKDRIARLQKILSSK